MKLHYKGKFDGNEESLPQTDHRPGAVQFREPDAKKFTLIANAGACAVAVLLLVAFFLRARLQLSSRLPIQLWIGCLLFLVTLFPHEILHALCFRGDVYLFTWFRRGALFVVGPEDMSRRRFIFMSLLPNLVFGVIPFAAFLIRPQLVSLGVFGVMALSAGFGDYMNVFFALTQVPRNALVYLHGFHSFWYQPNHEPG